MLENRCNLAGTEYPVLGENGNSATQQGEINVKKPTDFAQKPYNRCLSCPHRQTRCDGPRTSAMPLERWCEFMRDMKEINGLTNAYIADKAEISVKTVERLMAGDCSQDIRRETARRIEDAIIGSSNQYPCYLAFEESLPDESKLNDAMRDLERALADNQDYREALDKIHESYKTEMQAIRDEAQRKIDFLVEQVKRLNAENDNLWAENNRKSRVVDMFLAKQDFVLAEKKNETT